MARRLGSGPAVKRHVALFRRHPATIPLQLSRIAPLRRAGFIAGGRPPLSGTGPEATPSILGAVDIPGIADDLRADGISRPLRLPPALVTAIGEHCAAAGEPAVLRGAEDDPAAVCPPLAPLLADPALAAIATDYLGGTPYLLDVRLWWSAVNTIALHRLHFDCDDWRTVKFLFFLSDVDAAAGHVYVRGSHRRRPPATWVSPAKWQPEARLRRWYGDDAFVVRSGAAGTGFVIDPYGFHAGRPAEGGGRGRLTLTIQWGASFFGRSDRMGDAFRERIRLWGMAGSRREPLDDERHP